MGWEGKTLGEICAQLKDPARNGNRSLEALVEHVGTDHLVGWAWAPGTNPRRLRERKRRPARSSKHGCEPARCARTRSWNEFP